LAADASCSRSWEQQQIRHTFWGVNFRVILKEILDDAVSGTIRRLAVFVNRKCLKPLLGLRKECRGVHDHALSLWVGIHSRRAG
jgi:hypothetical protein